MVCHVTSKHLCRVQRVDILDLVADGWTPLLIPPRPQGWTAQQQTVSATPALAFMASQSYGAALASRLQWGNADE